MATLLSVLNDVAAFIDQDTTLATGTELTVRVNLINQAQSEWAETYLWSNLNTPAVLTFALSGTSVALPANFNRLTSPVYDVSVNPNVLYAEIPFADQFKRGAQDKYVTVGGNDIIGKYITFKPGMASGVSLNYFYNSQPTSLATLTDVVTCPSGEYLAKRTIAYILQSRSDSRFPLVKAEADNLMANMIDDEVAIPGGQDNRTPDYFKSNNYRVGRE